MAGVRTGGRFGALGSTIDVGVLAFEPDEDPEANRDGRVDEAA